MVRKRGERWMARPYVPGTGHVYGGTWDSEEEATKAALAVLDEERRIRGGELVRSFAERWVRDYPRPKESTNDLYRGVARRFAEKFGDRRLHRVSTAQAHRYALDHRSSLFALRAMYSDARRSGLVVVNPFASLRIPRGRGRRDIVAITEAELGVLADLASEVHRGALGVTVRAAIIFGAYTGLRPGELCGLDWGDLDLAAQECHVRRQVYRGSATPPKSGEARTIILAARMAVDALRSLPRDRVLCPVTGGEVVFGWKGRRMTTSDLSRAWRPVREAFKHKLPAQRLWEFQVVKGALDFYALRHFCATDLVERGIESWVIARQLGHRDGGRLVRETYAHPRAEIARNRLREVFERQDVGRPTPPVEPIATLRPRPNLISVERAGKVVRVDFPGRSEAAVSKRQIAAILGKERGRSYSRRWIELRVREGMPTTMKGNRRMFVPSEVRAWLAEHGKGTASV